MEQGEDTKPFASPGEALEHHGVKGMRWGVRKDRESSSREPAATKEAASISPAAKRETTPKGPVPQKTPLSKAVANRNVTEKESLTRAVETAVGKNATVPKREVQKVTSIQTSPKKESESESHKGMTPGQKKAALVGVGVGVGIAGFVAYRMYVNKTGAPPSWVADLAKGPISKTPLGKLGESHFAYALKHPQDLNLDISKGYADFTPKAGLNNYAKGRHAELISTLEQMRERYPAIRNMNIDVVPMSQVEGMEAMGNAKCPAAVMSLRKGEARVMYNDLMTGLDSGEKAYVGTMQPGVFTKNFLGNHEMGHLLAAAHGDLPPAIDLVSATPGTDQIKKTVSFKTTTHFRHIATIKRHGLGFKQLSKLSPYAATEPAEALAELSGHYFTPKFRAQMSPEDAAKAKALFDELGGVTA